MTSALEREAIATLFNTGWGVPAMPVTPVAYANDDFKPPDDDSWVRLTIIAGEAFPLEFGSAIKQYRHLGVVVVQVFTPKGKGDKAALDLADQVAAIFRGQQVIAGANGRVIFRTPAIEPIGVDDPYYQVNVETPFIRDTLF